MSISSQKSKAVIVSEVFLKLSQPEVGDVISNLKLQKLLYYAQGYHLAIYDKPLFDNDILAWTYGPVVKEVYYEYSNNGANALPIPQNVNTDSFTHDQIDLLGEIYSVFGQYSGLKLMEMTHNEAPWLTTPRNEIITHEKLKAFFSPLVSPDVKKDC